MKKTFKRTMGMAMAAVMSVTMAVVMPAAAEEITENVITFDDVLETLSYHLTAYYGVTGDDYYIGSEIPSYSVIDGEVEFFNGTLYYPVYCEDEAVGVFYVYFDDDGGATFSYTDMLAEQLEEPAPTDNYCLFLDEENEYIVSETKTYSLSDNDILFTSTNAEKILVPSAVNMTRAASSKSLSVPVWNQTQNGTYYGLCWAGSMWSIGKYLTGISSYTPFTIADEMGIGYWEGANSSAVITGFSDLYDLSAKRTSKPTNARIMTYINNGTPIYMSMDGDVDNKGHAMVLRGYTDTDTENTFVIITMDPYGGTTRTMSSKTSTYTIKYSNVTYTWNSAIVPQ